MTARAKAGRSNMLLPFETFHHEMQFVVPRFLRCHAGNA